MLDDTNPARCKRYKELTFEVKPGANEFNIEHGPDVSVSRFSRTRLSYFGQVCP